MTAASPAAVPLPPTATPPPPAVAAHRSSVRWAAAICVALAGGRWSAAAEQGWAAVVSCSYGARLLAASVSHLERFSPQIT